MSEAESKKKVRSPSFPFIGLREALDRARAFYEAEQRNAARPETAAAHWGYSPKSSGGKLGPGIPEEFQKHLPYVYGFGCNPNNPLEIDLTGRTSLADTMMIGSSA